MNTIPIAPRAKDFVVPFEPISEDTVVEQPNLEKSL